MPLKEGEDFNSILRYAARRKGDRRAAVRHRRSPSPLAARRSPLATRPSFVLVLVRLYLLAYLYFSSFFEIRKHYIKNRWNCRV